MPKDFGEEYQPLLVKERKDGKRTKVCDELQSSFTPEDPHKAPGLPAFLNECTSPPSFFLFFANFWDLTFCSVIWTPHEQKSTLNIAHLWEILKMKAWTHYLAADCTVLSFGWVVWAVFQRFPAVTSVIVASALSPSLLFWLNGHSDYLKLDYQVFFSVFRNHLLEPGYVYNHYKILCWLHST